jgi:hypothetical protein
VEITLHPDRLTRHAAAVLAPGTSLAPAGEPFFDPALPLPLSPSPVPPPGFPSFTDLFRIVPEPYARLIEAAYVQMSDFAADWCPPVQGVVHAEPFFEWMMHADVFKPAYRDHIVHQLNVAAIGDLLLHQRLGGTTLLARAAAELAPVLDGVTADPEAFVRLAWWLAALFHDCGYPYQFHHDYYRHLARVYNLPLASPTDASWHACHRHLAELAGGLSAADLDACEQGYHSFFGAAELANEEQRYRLGPGRGEDPGIRKRRQSLFALAARAILRHHSRARISFAAEPLGYLLVLSDELHEARRPLGLTETLPARPGAGGGRTIVSYSYGDLLAARVYDRGPRCGPKRLHLSFRCRRHTTTIRGTPILAWERRKRKALARSLAFGDDQLFRDLTVTVVTA